MQPQLLLVYDNVANTKPFQLCTHACKTGQSLITQAIFSTINRQ